MTLLLAIEDAGLGALFFGIFTGTAELRTELRIPADVEILGAIAIGVPRLDAKRSGKSSVRQRHSSETVTHFGGWTNTTA
jgi:nitroreductase